MLYISIDSNLSFLNMSHTNGDWTGSACHKMFRTTISKRRMFIVAFGEFWSYSDDKTSSAFEVEISKFPYLYSMSHNMGDWTVSACQKISLTFFSKTREFIVAFGEFRHTGLKFEINLVSK